MQLCAHFRLAFAAAPGLKALNLAAYRNSPVRSTKSTRSHLDRASSACKHRVSGSLSLPSRGPFHLSLTVLCAIGHQVVFSLGRWSSLLPAGFHVSCGTLGLGWVISGFDYGAITLSGWAFHPSSSTVHESRLPARNPLWQATGFGLFPVRSPLLRKSIFLSLPPGT